jgi:hypothetical protein
MPVCKLVSAVSASPKPLIEYMRNPEKAIDPDRYKESHGRDINRRVVGEEYSHITVSSSSLIDDSTPDIVIGTFKGARLSANNFRLAENKQPIKREYIHLVVSYDVNESKNVDLLRCHLERTMNEFAPKTHWTASLHKVNFMRLENNVKEFAWHWHICMNTVTNELDSIPTEKIWDRLRDISDRHAKELGLNVIDKPVYNPAFTREGHAERAVLHRSRGQEELMITTLRNRVREVLQTTTSKDLLDYASDLNKVGVHLYRASDSIDGSLVYLLKGDERDFYARASKLGALAQTYGVRVSQQKGYAQAVAHLQNFERNVDMRPYNIRAAHSAPGPADYVALPLAPGDHQMGDAEKLQRALIVQISLATAKAKTERQYFELLAKYGIHPTSNDTRSGYQVKGTFVDDKKLPRFAQYSEISKRYQYEVGDNTYVGRKFVDKTTKTMIAERPVEQVKSDKYETTLEKQNRIERDEYNRDMNDGRGGDAR